MKVTVLGENNMHQNGEEQTKGWQKLMGQLEEPMACLVNSRHSLVSMHAWS